MARKQATNKPPKLGTVYTSRAKCYGADGKLLGKCIDTPNGIAKAMMEQPAITMAIGQFGELHSRAAMGGRMNRHNTAQSFFVGA